MMSGAEDLEKEGAADICCASCGIAEVDDVKLLKCDDCDLVRYCSDECKEDHRPEHEAICKERAAELRDELLFRQPESTHLGDCPICCVPLNASKLSEFTMFGCCCKFICKGCEIANMFREWQANMSHACPFCRQPLLKESESEDVIRERVEANDPVAIIRMGVWHFQKEDYEAAIECYRRAAELGDADAHFKLGSHYCEGKYVEKDEKKGVYHLEEAAIAGHPEARYELALHEFQDDAGVIRAINHFIIAANLGHEKSLEPLRHCYTHELISKEVFAASLRAYQAAVEGMKSPNRERAAASIRDLEQHSSEEIAELRKKFLRQTLS